MAVTSTFTLYNNTDTKKGAAMTPCKFPNTGTTSKKVVSFTCWWWMWISRSNDNWQRKPKYSEKTYHSATLSTTNPTWPFLGSNTNHRCGKPATNRLTVSYDTAFWLTLVWGMRCWYPGERSLMDTGKRAISFRENKFMFNLTIRR
jgi:hypothetical protein